MPPRKPVTSGAERAHIFRDKARGAELKLTQLEAAKLAGEDVDDADIATQQERLDALLGAADAAEQAKGAGE